MRKGHNEIQSTEFWQSISVTSNIDVVKELSRYRMHKLSKIRNLNKQGIKFKLLQFHTECRPGYWGTFCKKSKSVTGRRPFAQDESIWDYSIDSDDEWEDDDPNGENISEGCEDEDDEEEDCENLRRDGLVEDGWLLPEDEDKCFSVCKAVSLFNDVHNLTTCVGKGCCVRGCGTRVGM